MPLIRSLTFFILCLCLADWATPAAHAHGLQWAVSPTPASVVSFAYAGGEPMSYAGVKVFAPGNTQVEHQNAFTDKFGQFAFVPSEAGTWRVIADDGVGHRIEATLEIASPAAQAAHNTEKTQQTVGAEPPTALAGNPANQTTSFTMRLAFGLSVLANIFLALYIVKKRS